MIQKIKISREDISRLIFKKKEGRDMKTVDVVIPTYKPGQKFIELIQKLEQQTYPVKKIRVVNTGEAYWKKEYETFSKKMEITHVTEEYYDHGRTRDYAARCSDADYVLFMTQDAVPADEWLVEQLVKNIEKEDKIAAVYACQLPAEDCGITEKFTRKFNYPEESRIKSKEDLPELGIKTYFCSNVCAMYDMEVYIEIGGFEKKIIFNEDMVFAGKLIQKGYKVAYAADAKVIHSHNYTALQQFHRNFDMGVSQADHPEIFQSVPSEKEGIRLVKETARWLKAQGKTGKILSLIWNSGWKYLGYRMGKAYKALPEWLVQGCTMNKMYWQG